MNKFKSIYDEIIKSDSNIRKNQMWNELLRKCGISEFELNNKSFWQRAKFKLLVYLIDKFIK